MLCVTPNRGRAHACYRVRVYNLILVWPTLAEVYLSIVLLVKLVVNPLTWHMYVILLSQSDHRLLVNAHVITSSFILYSSSVFWCCVQARAPFHLCVGGLCVAMASEDEALSASDDEDFKIDDVLQVTRSQDKDAKANFNVKRVGETRFVCIETNTRKLERVLVGGKVQNREQRCGVLKTVVRKLRAARDKAFSQLLGAKSCSPPSYSKKTRYTSKNVKHHVLSMPEVIDIEINGVVLKAICGKPRSQLWIEGVMESFKTMAALLDAAVVNNGVGQGDHGVEMQAADVDVNDIQ